MRCTEPWSPRSAHFKSVLRVATPVVLVGCRSAQLQKRADRSHSPSRHTRSNRVPRCLALGGAHELHNARDGPQKSSWKQFGLGLLRVEVLHSVAAKPKRLSSTSTFMVHANEQSLMRHDGTVTSPTQVHAQRSDVQQRQILQLRQLFASKDDHLHNCHQNAARCN